MKFYFCETCGKRISEADVEAGQARNKKLKGVFCAQCADGVKTLEMLPVNEDEARKILGKPPSAHSNRPPSSEVVGAKPKRDSTGSLLTAVRKSSEPASAVRSTSESAGKSRSVLIGVGAGLLLALGLGLLLLFTGNEKPKPTATGIPNTAGKSTEGAMPSPSNSAASKTPPVQDAPGKTTPADKKTEPGSVIDARKDEPTSEKGTEEPKPPAGQPATQEKGETHVEPASPISNTDAAAQPAPGMTEPATSAPNIPAAAKVEIDPNEELFADVFKDLSALLRRNQFSDADKMLDEKIHAPALAGIVERLKREKADLGAVRALRQRAVDSLRAKNGSTATLTLRGTKMTGTLKASPNSSDLSLALRNGPEMTLKADQLDAQDIDENLPLETGQAKSDDLWQRGLLFQAAGDMAKAESYFTKARDAGSRDAPNYLERLASIKITEKDAAAMESWKKAEALFAAKSWKAARQAYESFQHDFAGSPTLAANAETLKTRLLAIDEASATKEISLDLGGGARIELVLIPAGEFEMGSNDGDKNEKPVHKVKITKAFYFGKFMVTQAQYEKVMGSNPSIFKGENQPVENLTYETAEEFCKKLGQLTSHTVRLPTEAEWEYACRAGSKTTYNLGATLASLEQAAWFKNTADSKPHPVGQKKPNAWGLYDMHGNIWQWCHDWYQEDYYASSPAEDPQGPNGGGFRIQRGGSWYYTEGFCRSAFRGWGGNLNTSTDYGVRIVVPVAKTP